MATPIDAVPGARFTLVKVDHYPTVCVFDAADGISNAVMRGVDWEQNVCAALARWYVPGTDVVDVGANLGLNALGLHRRRPVTGTMHLFEPQHDVFAALRFNARGLPAKLYNMAVSDSARVLCFEQVHGNIGGTPMQSVTACSTSGAAENSPFAFPLTGQATHVLAAPLDDIFCPVPQSPESPESRSVSVIKIDVEGAELAVLRGAQRLITRDRPVIVLEVFPKNRAKVFEFLRSDLSYVLHENIDDTFGDDFVWLPAEGRRQDSEQVLL